VSKYPNSGALFKNKQKKSDKSPDYYGSLDVNGVDYDLSAWLKANDKGTFMSLSIRPKQERQPQSSPPAQNKAPEQDQDIPF
jgi:hypothetical protein